MKVKTLKDHFNDYGAQQGVPIHKLGSSHLQYDIPNDDEAQILIDAGIVEEVKSKD